MIAIKMWSFFCKNNFRYNSGTCLMAQMLKNLPVMEETHVQSLSRADPLEKGMATCSSILDWRILASSRTEDPHGLQSLGSKRVRHDLATNTQHRCNSCIIQFSDFWYNSQNLQTITAINFSTSSSPSKGTLLSLTIVPTQLNHSLTIRLPFFPAPDDY